MTAAIEYACMADFGVRNGVTVSTAVGPAVAATFGSAAKALGAQNAAAVVATAFALAEGIGAGIEGVGFCGRATRFKPRCARKKPNSFAEGTLVLTRAGLKPIESLRVGDEVAAYNAATNAPRWQKITGRSSRWSNAGTIKLTLRHPDGREDVQYTTPGHPYLSAGDDPMQLVRAAKDGDWRAAITLKPGDKLESTDGTDLLVAAISLDATPRRVYNFEVAGDHSYAVGELRVWVHNGKSGGDRMHGPLPGMSPAGCFCGLGNMSDDALDDLIKVLEISVAARKTALRPGPKLPGHSEKIRRELRVLTCAKKKRSKS